MEIEKLNYHLPPQLIAQKPSPKRDSSRLLVLNRSDGSITDSNFSHICNWLHKGDCLVTNNTRVLPAKFFAQRESGAKIEGLFLSQNNLENWQVLLKNASRLKEGEVLHLLDRNKNRLCSACAEKRLSEGRWLLKPDCPSDVEKILSAIGFAPLPPYIKRPNPQIEHKNDLQRYQTVYASQNGAIAAPTAGLHFTAELLKKIRAKDVKIAQLTLHVGEGTFLPVKTKTLEEHKIHSERFSIDTENANIINEAIRCGGRIIAVGTTTVRTLEAVAAGRSIKPANGQTNLFITPGFEFKITDAMITNFHLPKSTLFALVATFAGLDKILAAYRYAIAQKYRFYSYGDCMLIV
jgi:S-adenosylmethionine:tRNA ribosyltransferase-isomerase